MAPVRVRLHWCLEYTVRPSVPDNGQCNFNGFLTAATVAPPQAHFFRELQASSNTNNDRTVKLGLSVGEFSLASHCARVLS